MRGRAGSAISTSDRYLGRGDLKNERGFEAVGQGEERNRNLNAQTAEGGTWGAYRKESPKERDALLFLAIARPRIIKNGGLN